jgi:hypothetical protein
LALAPVSAWAQSAISGEVRDTSGAVLPGVTVEASSPALIENTRSVVTDGQGRYLIVDLRPGNYTLTYSLAGFQSVRRDGIQLASSVTVTINTELSVGALAETLTVTGDAPLVDAQSATKTQVLSKEVLDAVPSGRSVWAYAQLVVGAAGQPDVGGSKGLHYPAPSLRGSPSGENSYMLDGLNVSTAGNAPQYFNTQQVNELVYQTSGLGATVSGGGLMINMIPKEGGNQFHGDFFGADMVYQGDNFSDYLKSKKMVGVDSIDKIWDVNPSIGGPLIREKLWFFSSYRWWGMNQPIANSFYKDGTQNIDDNHIQDLNGRLTWQVSPRNKLSVYYDRQQKFRGHDTTAGVDPETAATVWTSPYYGTETVKWTSPLSSKLLVDTGFNATFQDYWQTMRPGIMKERGSQAWLAGAAKRDLSLGTQYGARDGISLTFNHRYGLQSSMSYVTGSNTVKAGYSAQFARGGGINDGNADLTQQYTNGVPTNVVIRNTPVFRVGTNRVSPDLGVFAQDQLTLRRLTANLGIRWEYFHGMVTPSESPAGRFVGARSFPEVDNIPNWKNWAPRIGLAYDLRGDGRTALKFGYNWFNQQASPSRPGSYDPVAQQTSTLRWVDLNLDDVAQGDRGCVFQTAGCEIDFSTLPSNFGVRNLNRFDPNMTRPYSVEWSAQVQHELAPGLSVNFGWYSRDFKNDVVSVNEALTAADYSPLTIVNPLDGERITIYNISAAAASRATNFLDTNYPDNPDLYGRRVTSWEGSFTSRLRTGTLVAGGIGWERSIGVQCYVPDNPNNARFCDQRTYDVPFRTQIKLNGVQPLPWGLQIAGNLDSEPGALVPGVASGGSVTTGATGTNSTFLRLTRTTRYPATCNGCTPGELIAPTLTQATLNVQLVPPGTEYLDRYYLLDISLSRNFTYHGVRLSPQFDVFNSLNQSPVHQVQTMDLTAATYMTPIQTLQARMIRLSARIGW